MSGTVCRHLHTRYETPSGPTSAGTCLDCGAPMRALSNVFAGDVEHAGGELSSDQQRRRGGMRNRKRHEKGDGVGGIHLISGRDTRRGVCPHCAVEMPTGALVTHRKTCGGKG